VVERQLPFSFFKKKEIRTPSEHTVRIVLSKDCGEAFLLKERGKLFLVLLKLQY
jgi:hypothetical protein